MVKETKQEQNILTVPIKRKSEQYLMIAIIIETIFVVIILAQYKPEITNAVQYTMLTIGVAYAGYLIYVNRPKPDIWEIAERISSRVASATGKWIDYTEVESEPLDDDGNDILIQFWVPYQDKPILYRWLNGRVLGISDTNAFTKARELNKLLLTKRTIEVAKVRRDLYNELERQGYAIPSVQSE